MTEWDYEREGKEAYRHPVLMPWLVFWYDLQILAVCAALIVRWAVLLGAQSVEAEMGFSWQKPGGQVRERHYRLKSARMVVLRIVCMSEEATTPVYRKIGKWGGGRSLRRRLGKETGWVCFY